MPVIKISKHTTDALPSVEKTVIFFDEELKRFGLKIAPTGARPWVVEYRPGISGRGTPKRRVSPRQHLALLNSTK